MLAFHAFQSIKPHRLCLDMFGLLPPLDRQKPIDTGLWTCFQLGHLQATLPLLPGGRNNASAHLSAKLSAQAKTVHLGIIHLRGGRTSSARGFEK